MVGRGFESRTRSAAGAARNFLERAFGPESRNFVGLTDDGGSVASSAAVAD